MCLVCTCVLCVHVFALVCPYLVLHVSCCICFVSYVVSFLSGVWCGIGQLRRMSEQQAGLDAASDTHFTGFFPVSMCCHHRMQAVRGEAEMCEGEIYVKHSASRTHGMRICHVF